TNVFTVQGSHMYSAVGIYPVTVTLHHDGAADVTASSTALVFAPVLHFSSPSPSPTTAGDGHNFTITVHDAFGATLSGYPGTVHGGYGGGVPITSSAGRAGLPADHPFTAADAGTFTFTATLKTAGTQSLTATDKTTTSSTATQSGIVVNPAAASTFAVSASP